MRKSPDHFPAIFAKIPRLTFEQGIWTIELPTESNARSLRTNWYAYVRVLKEANRLTEHIAAASIKCRTDSNVVIFEDRNQDPTARALEARIKELDPKFAADQMEEEIALGVRNADGSLKV